MTGKQLKDWAAKVSDEATIETRERSYGTWNTEFQLRAVVEITAETKPEQAQA